MAEWDENGVGYFLARRPLPALTISQPLNK